MQKRGAMELSIGTIVIIVLAMSMLILGLVLIRTIFTGAKYNIDTIVSGALASNYQKSRIENICKKLNLECLSPLWHKDEVKYLQELIDNNFKVIITGVFAYPLDKSWLGREIDKKFVKEVTELHKKYKLHPAGEGGEFETFVLNCPLFKKSLKVARSKISSTGKHSHKLEITVE